MSGINRFIELFINDVLMYDPKRINELDESGQIEVLRIDPTFIRDIDNPSDKVKKSVIDSGIISRFPNLTQFIKNEDTEFKELDNGDPAVHKIELYVTDTCITDGFLDLLKYIQKVAQMGHSFDVVVDPDNKEYDKKFPVDGDGADKIRQIGVFKIEEEKESMANDENDKDFQEYYKKMLKGNKNLTEDGARKMYGAMKKMKKTEESVKSILNGKSIRETIQEQYK